MKQLIQTYRDIETPAVGLSDIIFKHASAGNLDGFRTVKPSEHKVLCYEYMRSELIKPSGCSHWIKPGDYVEEYMPVIDDDFFSFRDKIPTSAKAAAIAIEEGGENVPTCLACVCHEYAETIRRKLERWVDVNIGWRPECGGPQNRIVEDFIRTENFDEFFNFSFLPYGECQTTLACNHDPLLSESFEQWSTVIWNKWYEASLVQVLLSKRGRTGSEIWDGEDDNFWNPIMDKLRAHASKRQSEYLEWQRTFFQESENRTQIQAEAEILLHALKHFRAPNSVIRHLTSIVEDTPESFAQLIR
jgi:hypothetical protein